MAGGGIRPDDDNVKAISELERPLNVSQVRTFLVAIGYYRRFVPGFARLERPLALLLKRNAKWAWTVECDEAFSKLKYAVVNSPVLKVFSQTAETILRTDARGVSLSAVLSQVEAVVERPVLFLSGRLTGTDHSHWSTNHAVNNSGTAIFAFLYERVDWFPATPKDLKTSND